MLFLDRLCHLVQALHIQDCNFAMLGSAVARRSLGKKFQLVRRFFGVHADKINIEMLACAHKGGQAVGQFNGCIFAILVLLDNCTGLVCVICHPAAGALDTRKCALVCLVLLHAACAGTTFAGKPLVGRCSSDGCHQHKEEYGNKRDA